MAEDDPDGVLWALPEPVRHLTGSFLAAVDQRLPGRLTGLLLHGSLCWGEFFDESDVDFVAVWDVLPDADELDRLAEAHHVTAARFPELVLDGFHCSAQDLRRAPSDVGPRPVFYERSFEVAGDLDINLVTWHELAERPVVIRGGRPDVHTDLEALLAFTRDNLDSYWRSTLARLEAGDVAAAGAHDETVAWVVLGAARLHHLLKTRTLTSKSGAGRYVVDALEAAWEPIGREALRIRERPDAESSYDDLDRRGRDMKEFLQWVVDDGTH